MGNDEWKRGVEQSILRSTAELLGGDVNIDCGRCGARYSVLNGHYCHSLPYKTSEVSNYPIQKYSGSEVGELLTPVEIGRENPPAASSRKKGQPSKSFYGEPIGSVKKPNKKPIAIVAKCLNCSRLWNVSNLETNKGAVRCTDCDGFVVTPSGRTWSKVLWEGQEKELKRIANLEPGA